MGMVPTRDVMSTAPRYSSGTKNKTAVHAFRPETRSWSSSVVLVSMIVLYLSLLFDDVLVCLPFYWCPCMAINVSVQYDGGFLPDIVYDRLGCDIIGLQETRRSGQSAFSQAGYLVYCSGECGGENNGKKGQGGVGLAVRISITRAARPPEFISDRLLKVTLELRGRAKAVTFVVTYAPTEPQNGNNKHAFWTSLDRVMEEVPKHGQLFVLMDANARTGRREKGQVGSKDSKILGAYGRDTLNDNGELLLSFANNHDLALVNTFFSTPKGGVSHTFNGRGKKRIDYILTRQRDRKFVRNVTVHPQPSFLPISDHNIVSAPVKLLGHFARNRRLRASAKKPPVDRRRLVTDPNFDRRWPQRLGGISGQTRLETAVWTTSKPHSPQPSCGSLNW